MHVVPVHHIEVKGDLSAPMSADDARAVACALLRAADILDGETHGVTDVEKAGDELIAERGTGAAVVRLAAVGRVAA
jgi:hypothetical protein